MFSISLINWLAVVVAAIVAFVVGMIWYSPQLFGKEMMESMPKSRGGKKPSVAMPMLGAFIATLITAFVLEALISAYGTTSYTGALKWAGAIWLGFYFAYGLVGLAYGQISMKNFVVNRAHDLIALAVIAVVLVAMV